YVLGTFGGFTIGDRVRVTGEVDPFCITFCQQGNGCILNNTIESCDVALLGRCCFLGIVPEPILCEVTTETECFQYAAPISWTPGIGCDVPCDLDQFSGCGELAIGPQGCVLLLADSGEIYAVANTGGFFPGDRVWVTGTINPASFLCFPATIPGIENNTIGECFEGCGTIVQGVECVLFQADAGGLYILDNLDGFSVGDRVEVTGCLNAPCVSFCQQGDGCIRDNTIRPCPEQFFSGCGMLGIGPQSCLLFHAEGGQTFAVGNTGGFVPGDRVWVTGVIDPDSPLCFPVIIPGIADNTIGPCFDRCGRIIQVGGCVLFRSQGRRYVLDNLGPFDVGDRVRVTGCLNEHCITICPVADGCIEDNEIGRCNPSGQMSSFGG
ncbi:MAG: hypothetical protein ACYTG1_13480, partial [Planctomycetota bacterium]